MTAGPGERRPGRRRPADGRPADGGPVATHHGPRPGQRIWRPEMARAITSRWISLVPSKIV